MDGKAEDAVGHGIVDDIGHLNALAHFTEMVLVVPEPIWSKTLLVHEVVRRGNMGYLRHPAHGETGKRLDPVFDDEAGVHARWRFRADVETEPVGGYRAQVSGVAEKGPCFGKLYRQHLDLLDLKNSHRHLRAFIQTAPT